jgi:hypothetical protein
MEKRKIIKKGGREREVWKKKKQTNKRIKNKTRNEKGRKSICIVIIE